MYRPPKPHPSFLSDFSDFITHLNTISSSVLLLGDFNFHIDNPTFKQASNFLDLLDTLNLTQHVHSPTHSHGHTNTPNFLQKPQIHLASGPLRFPICHPHCIPSLTIC
ncbi:PREDICTED: uncharacterized protein LOC109521672 [Xyrichtys novacula]|uniref:PREDICTED: uncharacterized protein LOC109521672 n=1 Tax=Xyrichtys novacula TaxID=13765 RepID=A0AAV1F437_XYRNO|nr:PREDICTED: uncharacterized protein LOC109521672 [Xyrichtys novacula]